MRICKKCGNQIADDSVYCPVCGDLDNAAMSQQAGTVKYNGMAVISFCMGLGTLLINPLGVIAIGAIVIGIIAKKQHDRDGGKGSGLATAGIILGVINFAIYLLSILVFIGKGGI